MKLGIIGAMDIEIAALRENMKNLREEARAGMTFLVGALEGLEAVVVQ